VIRADCDADLAAAMPILNRAQAALDTLTLADIAIVKAMKHPPYGVRLIVESVCVLKVQDNCAMNRFIAIRKKSGIIMIQIFYFIIYTLLQFQ